MEMIKRTKNEYGGFLPLELNPGQELFAKYEEYLCRFNSVKASLAFILKAVAPKKIYIPYYYCPSTVEAIKDTGVEVIFYHITSTLEPYQEFDEYESAVLLVDYFGVKSSEVQRIAKNYTKATVILDYAHSFFAKPLFVGNIYNVYSAKKFFGIPDGSYVVSQKKISHVEILSDSYTYAGYLLNTYEKGTNAAYFMKKESDKMIASNYDSMSKLSIGLLENVDYDRVKKQRISNYKILHQGLGSMNELRLPLECVAYQYPLLINKNGRKIKKKLVEDRIFVSTLWAGSDLMANGNEFEINMSENGIFLPMDQRYNEEDMNYIVEKVKEIINENT